MRYLQADFPGNVKAAHVRPIRWLVEAYLTFEQAGTACQQQTFRKDVSDCVPLICRRMMSWPSHFEDDYRGTVGGVQHLV